MARELSILAEPAFNLWFDGLRYDVIGHGTTYSFGDWDPATVCAVRMGGDTNGEIRRVVLPEHEFPEFYVTKRRMLWLETTAARIRSQAPPR